MQHSPGRTTNSYFPFEQRWEQQNEKTRGFRVSCCLVFAASRAAVRPYLQQAQAHFHPSLVFGSVRFACPGLCTSQDTYPNHLCCVAVNHGTRVWRTSKRFASCRRTKKRGEEANQTLGKFGSGPGLAAQVPTAYAISTLYM